MANLKSAAPLYLQVRQELRHEILSGALQPQAKLETEAALMKRFNISRVTIRKAVAGLVDEGLVRRVPGSGTYVNRRQARSNHISQRTGHIALQMNDLHMAITAAMRETLRGINAACEASGMSTGIFLTDPRDPTAPTNIILNQALTERRCDGLISMSSMDREAYLQMLDLSTPVVLTFESETQSIPSVSGDIFDTHEQIAHFVIEAGWRTPAVLRGPAPTRLEEMQGRSTEISGFRVAEGFRRGLIDMGLPYRPTHLLSSDYRPERAAELTETVMRLQPRPDVLIVDGQEMAEALQQHLPPTIAVIGIGPRTTTTKPTIVQIPFYEVGRGAAELLCRHIQNPSEPVTQSYCCIDRDITRKSIFEAYDQYRRICGNEQA
jgi:DNA-binding LacI/PurR family transcriptional regulator